jgi:carotenoid 1,2-hydratase
MPTLPLYILPQPSPDASHQVTAPGGYEWWHFDAEDPATDTQIVAALFDGFVSHPQYLREYRAYRRRPTRHAPPVPADYPCVCAAVYRNGRALAQFITPFPRGSLTASTERLDAQIGPNVVRQEGDGRYHIEFTGESLRLALTFTPTLVHAAHERTFLSREMTGAEHHWVIAAPQCDVSGTVRVTPSPGQPKQAIDFTGVGYHDHRYGTGPIGPGLRRWTWGRILLDDGGAVTFHAAEPRDPAWPAETHLVVADASGITERTAVEWHVAAERRIGATGPSLPERIQLGHELSLSAPRLLDASSSGLRATYAAEWNGRRASAFCEVVYPHRLRWPRT